VENRWNAGGSRVENPPATVDEAPLSGDARAATRARHRWTSGGRLVDDAPDRWRYIRVVHLPGDDAPDGPQLAHRRECPREQAGCGTIHRIHSPYGYHVIQDERQDSSSAVWMRSREDDE
jgi:hypothetical protein